MFENDDERYQALCERNPAAEGRFVYCVVSTKIFCRPTCSSKLAKRRNVIFVNNSAGALKLGYRPCKRCKPDIVKDWNNSRQFILKACKLIYQRSKIDSSLDVELILHNIGVSKWHFFRTFKTYTGLTPRQFFRKCLTVKVDPLILSPLPLIQTKKNIQLRKELCRIKKERSVMAKGDERLSLSSPKSHCTNKSADSSPSPSSSSSNSNSNNNSTSTNPSSSSNSQQGLMGNQVHDFSEVSSVELLCMDKWSSLADLCDELISYDTDVFTTSSVADFMNTFTDETGFQSLLQMLEL
jgi:methylphosphotriester-DNA--protein-cysteine methyltransferase